MISEHVKLAKHLDAHQAAMRKMDMRAMDDASKLEEGARLRIGTLESRRRVLVNQLAAMHGIAGKATIIALADAIPDSKAKLLGLRDELKAVVQHTAARATIAGRLAVAIAGHLNTAVRLIAGAVEQAGLYTKYGVPKVSNRIGVIEAVG